MSQEQALAHLIERLRGINRMACLPALQSHSQSKVLNLIHDLETGSLGRCLLGDRTPR